VLNNTCEYLHTLCKTTYALVHARLCNGAAASLPWKLLRTYHESCANIVQAVVCRAPPAGNPSPNAARFKNPSKSTLAHDAVAAAVLHKHHPIIPIGAGLIQFVYDSRSLLAKGGYPSEKCISAIFAPVHLMIRSRKGPATLGAWRRGSYDDFKRVQHSLNPTPLNPAASTSVPSVFSCPPL